MIIIEGGKNIILKTSNMVYKTLVFGVIVLFLCMSITPAVAINNVKKSNLPLSDGNTLYVGGIGDGNYSKIQDAIDNASDGDTVFVYNGTYYENIDIDKYGISLIGEDKDTTIIDGSGILSVILIVENNYDVTISGFTIQNAGSNIWDDAGIEIHSGFNKITGNIIRGNPQHGIIINNYVDSACNDITQNIIIDNKHGITLDYAIYNNVYENYVANNSIGIFVGTSVLPTGNAFTSLNLNQSALYEWDNYIYSNIIKNNDKGIVIEPWTDTYIFNNSIIENGVGIRLSAPFLTTCFNNHIYQNKIINNSCGVLINQEIGGKYSKVKDNEIYHNNFINNRVNAYGNGDNIWKENYWDDWIGLKYKILRFFPYRIKWTLLKNIDWHPAKEPYDIEV